MKLESLTLNNYSYNDKVACRATFKDSSSNTISLELDKELASEIVEVCAEAIVAAVRRAQERFTREALNIKPAIEHNKEEEDLEV